MNLYLLTRIVKPGDPDLDVADAFVIAAKTATAARHIAAERCGDEGPATWLLLKRSSCELLALGTVTKRTGVILRSFTAG